MLSSFDEKAGILNWFGVTSDEFKQHIKFKREIGLEASSAGGIKFLFSNLRKNTILFQIATKTKNIASNILSASGYMK